MISSYWPTIEADLIQHIGRGEIATFLEWSVVKAVMFVGPCGVVDNEQAEMLSSDPMRWVIGPEYGGYPNSNLIHQAYHLYQWERQTGRRVSDLSRIVEIGGGYGAMVRVCRQLGFTGEYVIHDLPVMTDLQHYYLKQTQTDATLYSNIDSVYSDLLIALFSLSEMDDDTQSGYLNTLNYGHFLLGLNNAPWHGIEVNARLNSHFDNGVWVEHPHLSGRYYLIG